MSSRNSLLSCIMLGFTFALIIQLADNRYIPYRPYYPLQPYHEGGAGYTGSGPPPLHGMIPYDHYQPVWTPHGTFFDQRRKVLRVFPGGGVPVIVDYDKRCSDGFIGVKKHPDHAQYYYACKSDCVIFGKCQDYQFFDANKGQCVPYPLPRYTPACTRPGHFPVYSNCTLYYTCDCSLKSETFSCPQGTIFSSAQGECINGRQCPPTEIAQGSYIPANCEQKYPPCLEIGTFRSPMDCSLYYKCAKQSNGVFLQTRFKCPGDTLFDTKQELCLPQQQVSCDQIQIAHLVYPASSHKSYPSNYYPYVADSEEDHDYTVSQPRPINCSNPTAINTSSEEISVEKGGRIISDSKVEAIETTKAPITTTTVATTTTNVQNTKQTTTASTEQQMTTAASTTSVQPEQITTVDDQSSSDETSVRSRLPARGSAISIADLTLISTTTELPATTRQLESTDSTSASSNVPTTVDDGSTTTALGSSTTSSDTTNQISTTNFISTSEQTATPIISTTEPMSTSESDSTTVDKSTSDILASTTEQKSTTTNEISSSETETSEGTSISTSQTESTDGRTEVTDSSSENTATPNPFSTTESSFDTQKTLHPSDTNTNTIDNTIAPNSEVLRDSRSIDSIPKDQQIAINSSSLTSHKITEDSEGCCSRERMVLDNDLNSDHSGSREEYDSLEEDSNEIFATSTIEPSISFVPTTTPLEPTLSQNSTTTENTPHIANTTQMIPEVQSAPQIIISHIAQNEKNESHKKSVLSDGIIINTTLSQKVDRTTSSTEANTVIADSHSTHTQNTTFVEEYDSQEYEELDEDTTTSQPLESSTVQSIETSTTSERILPAKNMMSSEPKSLSNSISDDENIIKREVLSDELVLDSITATTPKIKTHLESQSNQNASTEEYTDEEYIDEDGTTEISHDIVNPTTSSPNVENNQNESVSPATPFHENNENVMVITKNTNSISKEALDLNSEILADVKDISANATNEFATAQHDIGEDAHERKVLSDEIVIDRTTISSDLKTSTIPTTTQFPQLDINVHTSPSTEASFEYESEEIGDEEFEDSSEQNILNDNIVIATTTQHPPTTTRVVPTSLPLSVAPPTENLPVSNIDSNNVDDNRTEPNTIAHVDTIASSYKDTGNVDNGEEEELREKKTLSDNAIETPAPSAASLIVEPLETPTQTLTTHETDITPPMEDNDANERLVLSDETLNTLPPNNAQITQAPEPVPVPAYNATQVYTPTQEPTENTFDNIRLINLHMRKPEHNKSPTHLEPVNNKNIIIGGATCIDSPFIPTLNLTIYGDINLHIRFCPRPCNETHVHNYERKPIVEAVWDSNSSNQTMSLQAIS